MKNIGGMGGIMGMMPGVGKMKKQIDAARSRRLGVPASDGDHLVDDEKGAQEPRHPEGVRKKRIAAGSGTRVEEINKLLKMHRQMSDMMKQMGRGKGMFARMGGMMGMPGMGGGGMPAMDPAALQKLSQGGGLPGLPGAPQLPPGVKLPGLGGGFPGLPGLPKKK
jgi:signal recognition particle subunit SRP54